MDTRQKEHVNANRVKLIEETNCNESLLAYLLSQKLLSKDEVEQIKSKTHPYERSSTLYDIMETKRGGFAAMKKALSKFGQTGACSVFTEEFSFHLSSKTKIGLLGKEHQLADYFNAAEISTINKNTNFDAAEYDSLNALQLLNETIPERTPYYVSRSLNRRVNINPELFKADCKDIFLFKGIDLVDLEELVSSQDVTSSTSQLVKPYARFVVLDNDEDWQEICNSAKVPVHLIKYNMNSEECILEATSGVSETIYDYLKDEADNEKRSLYVGENEFIKTALQDCSTGLCISDLPGMGKSCLLANLARTATEIYKEKIVAFIQLSHFVEHADKEKGSTVNATFVTEVLCQYLSTSKLACHILIQLINKRNLSFELFFDGFDEVPQQQIQFAKQLLTIISHELTNTRIFVTSRPHMRSELESALKVVSYEIKPFTRKNQIDFLVNYWDVHSAQKACDVNKLKEFADFCLKKLNSIWWNEKAREITGIPLQCRLVAETYSRVARIFASRKEVDIDELCKEDNSHSGMYKKLMDLRFSEVAKSERNAVHSPRKRVVHRFENVVAAHLYSPEHQNLRNHHIYIALVLLFPKYTGIYKYVVPRSKPLRDGKLLAVGLLKKGMLSKINQFEFLHFTFAEYLVADFLAGALAVELPQTKWRQPLKKQLLKFTFLQVLETVKSPRGFQFVHPVVVHFFNFLCQEVVNTPFESAVASVAIPDDISKFYALLSIVTRENHCNILKLITHLLSCCKGQMRAKLIKQHSTENTARYLANLLYIGAHYSTLPVTKQLFSLFRCLEIDLNQVCGQMAPGNYTPLNAAVRKGDFELVQFYARVISLNDTRMLLRDCIAWTKNEQRVSIKRRSSICLFLLKKKKNLIEEHRHVLLDSRNVHVDLIELLLKNGVNYRENCNNKTIVHKAAGYMEGQEFLQLCRFLIENKSTDLLTASKGKWDSPWPNILRNRSIKDSTVHEILDFLNSPLSFTEQSSSKTGDRKQPELIKYFKGWEHRILLFAAQAKRSIDFLNALIDSGANLEVQDERGNTFIHIIAILFSVEDFHRIVQILISRQRGQMFRMVNTKGETPLHLAAKYLELFPETVHLLVGRDIKPREVQISSTSLVELNAVDNNGRSVLYWAVMGNKSLALVKLFVKLGANCFIKAKHDVNLLHTCAQYGRLELLKYFRLLGCDINGIDNHGNNVLQSAINPLHTRLLEIVQFLVSEGANKGNKNKNGETAYTMGVERELDDNILRLLK